MTLIAIILGLSIEKLMPTLLQYRRFDWLFSYQQWMKDKFSGWQNWNDTLSLISIILLPVLGVALLHQQLYHLSGLLGFAFSVIVLAYSLGPRDIYGLTQQLLDLPDENCNDELRSIATHLLPGPLPTDPDVLYGMVKDKLLISINTNLLAVMFWFSLLGPMGAILYRLTLTLYESYPDTAYPETSYPETKDTPVPADDSETAPATTTDEYTASISMFFAIINWIPTHLTALCFAATGSFVDAVQTWKDHRVRNPLSNAECDDMLAHVGHSAMLMKDKGSICDAKPVVQVIIGMAKRSVILWLTVLALLTLSGWAG